MSTGITADLDAAVREAVADTVEILSAHRHHLPEDVRRTLAEIVECASRHGHDTAVCEAEHGAGSDCADTEHGYHCDPRCALD